MRRAILIVLDSVGVGHAPDAAAFFNGDVSDEGANTLGHIRDACRRGACDQRSYLPGEPKRDGELGLPNLEKLGFFNALHIAAGQDVATTGSALVTALREVSAGKDSTTGHLELCGLQVQQDWGYFPQTDPTFPPDLIDKWVRLCELPGVLGLQHASGTEILDTLGEDHLTTGKPIVYTSADSVFQVIAHEEQFGLERLYDICSVARTLCDPLNIGRVIARPFTGDKKSTFTRTGNRRDFAMPPPGDTLLDICAANDIAVHCLGKVGDLFAGRGVTTSTKASGLPALYEATIQALKTRTEQSLIVTNFVDFDTEFGHRRDVPGYAAALEYFDSRLPEILTNLQPGDLLLITADHGNDPSWPGSDHTREQVPLVIYGQGVKPGLLPSRTGFSDVGQTIATHLNLPPLAFGENLL